MLVIGLTITIIRAFVIMMGGVHLHLRVLTGISYYFVMIMNLTDLTASSYCDETFFVDVDANRHTMRISI